MTIRSVARAHLGVLLTALMLALVACGNDDKAAASATADPDPWPQVAWPLAEDAALEKRITDLMGTLTVEEKVGQLVQGDIASITPDELRKYRLGSILAGGNSDPGGRYDAAPAEWLALADAFYEASMDTSQGGKAIPVLFGIDAVHGQSNIIGATLFPHNIGLGATRNPELLRRIGEITALETRATGMEWAFAPTVAVPQDDRWGRTYEGYSESPDVVASYAGAMVEGLQGKVGSPAFLDGRHVIASVKHFLGDGGTTDGKDQGDTRISEAELVRIHAAGYPPAIAAGAQTVMASFNSVNGEKMHGHKPYLTDALKGRMHFGGLVVGDWNGHGQVKGCTTTDCPATINAGLDMAMASDSWKGFYETTLAAVKNGTIPQQRLDDAVRRILRVKMRLGLFEAGKPSSRAVGGQVALVGAPGHRDVARQAVRESLVLLKNQGRVLPLSPRQRILVAGDTLNDLSMYTAGFRGVCVGDSEPALTAATAALTHTFHAQAPGCGGILEAIEHFGLLATDDPFLHAPKQARADGADLVMVYHRLPFDEVMEDGVLVQRPPRSPNGIIPSLLSFFEGGQKGSWVAWGIDDPKRGPFQTHLAVDAGRYPTLTAARVPLSRQEVDIFYKRFSKEAFWPMLHVFWERAKFREDDWQVFLKVNRKFAHATAAEAAHGATVWIHDYNLWMVPATLRELRPDLKIAFFHHTYFPSADVFNVVPWRREIIGSLLSCDYIGERTRSFNAGIVLSPWSNTSLSVDYYRIELENLVGTNNTQTLVTDNVPGAVLRDERGKLLAVYNRYQNLSELKTSGFDVELRQRFPTDLAGDFTLSSAFTHVRNYSRPTVVGGPLVDYAGSNLGATLPKNKATTTFDWSYGDFRTALTWYYTSGYDQKASAAATAVQDRVDAYSQFDLYLGYTGIEKLTVYAKIQNLADEAPPYDASFPGIRAPYDFSQYDLRGRYFTVGFDYRF